MNAGRTHPAERARLYPGRRSGSVTRKAAHPPGEPFKTWEAPIFETTLEEVCVECNSGCMSKVEASAKPFALRLLALWAYLKCSLFQTMERDTRLNEAWECWLLVDTRGTGWRPYAKRWPKAAEGLMKLPASGLPLMTQRLAG